MVHAKSPSFDQAISAIAAYKAKAGLTEAQRDIVAEIERRMARLDAAAWELVAINNKLIDATETDFKTHFDPETGTFTVEVPGGKPLQVTFPRLNPDVPGTMEKTAVAGIYHAGDEPKDDRDRGALEQQLENRLEQYYYSASRIRDLVRQLPGRKKFDCRAITMVRNKLVEHPKANLPYTFGFGSPGPTVRPVHVSRGAEPAKREWTDGGLVPNTEAFVTALCDAFEGSKG
jgi:hypothetical protein